MKKVLMTTYGRYILGILFLVIGFTVYAGSVRVSVESGRGNRDIAVGDMFYINIVVSDVKGSPETPKSVSGAKVLYFENTGSSSRISTVNGHTTQSFSHTWTITLRAQKEGTYEFGPVSVGGEHSNKVTYHIVKSSDRTNGQNSANRQKSDGADNTSSDKNDTQSDKPRYIGKGDGNLFLKANVSKTTVYEQEALVYTVKLYTTYDAIKFIGATATPKFEGFVVEESKDISNQLTFETYNGKSYATAIIARYIIFPQMTGQLKVLGNTYTVSVNEREYYQDPFWGNLSYSKPLQLNVSPNDLTVDVKPLPQPKPADFSGGVGTFNITSSLNSDKLMTNQAASVVYTVTGSGNLKYVSLPDLNVIYPDQLEVYTPTTDIKTQVGSSNVSGSVKFDYSFMPLEEGSFSIPEIRLVYFNPATGKYETSVAKGYEVTVGKGQGSSKGHSVGAIKFNSKLMPVGKLQTELVTYVDRTIYWLCYILPFVVFVICVVWRFIYVKSHSDMDAVRSRKADKMARRRLKKAYVCMKHNDREHFYDEILIALWGYLGDKLRMPTSELMRDNIKNVLLEHDVAESDINALVSLLDECEFAKYSSAKGEGEMGSVYTQSIQTINLLDKSFKNKKNG